MNVGIFVELADDKRGSPELALAFALLRLVDALNMAILGNEKILSPDLAGEKETQFGRISWTVEAPSQTPTKEQDNGNRSPR